MKALSIRVPLLWARASRLATPVLLLCAGLSGAAALIYQVVWNRQFLTLFGSTTAATASTVAAFMGGMALGAALLARYADRLRHPLLLYGTLEAAIAFYALLFPLLLHPAEAIYAGLWQTLLANPLFLNALRLGLGLLLLGPPTLAMGATLPLLVSILGTRTVPPLRAVGRMYGVNAVGGSFGAATAGFLLIPRVGVTTTYGIGMALSLAAAAIAVLLWRLWPTPPRTVSDEVSGASARRDAPTARLTRALFPAALLLAGFAALGYEVVWTRMLVLITGSSTYAFTLMLVIYITGLALGSLWMANRVERLRAPRLVFAHLQIGVALAAAAGLWLFGYLPALLLSWYRQWGLSFGSALGADTLVASLVMLVPTFLLGAAFPVAVRISGSLGLSAARGTGRVYAWMTSGNVLGALAAGGVLIAGLGLQGTLLTLAGLSIVAGLLCAVTKRRAVRARGAALAAGVLMLLAGPWLQPRWDPVLMTSGVYKEAPAYLGLAGTDTRLHNILSSYRLLYYREGGQSVVSVVERSTLKRVAHRMLAIDGKVDASTGADMSTQVLSGHLPLLHHPEPRKVLVIGLASGVTVGAVAQHAGIDQVTVAEIEPRVVEAARQFASFNHDALTDPRVRLVLDDGRHYLGVTRERFDVIISEPSNPWMSGSARLFTQEFFRKVRERLNERGVFAQWLPLYGLSTPLLKTQVRTFLWDFPHVAMFQVSAGDLLLLGSAQPLHSWTDTALTTPIVNDLARVGFDGASLQARFITGERGLANWVGAGTVNTDDNGLTEFAAPRFLLADTLETNRSALAEAPWEADLADWVAGAAQRSPRTKKRLLRLARAYLAGGRVDCAEFLASRVPDSSEAMEILGDVAARRQNTHEARRWWQQAATPAAMLRLLESALDEGNTDAASYFLRRMPASGRTARFHYLQALVRMTTKDHQGALAALAGVPASTSNGRQMLAAYLRWALLQRLRPPGGDTESSPASFITLLDQLRARLEREEGQQTMDEMLRDIKVHGRRVLDTKEHRRLLRTVRTRLTDPLALYYRGVSLLWLGEPEKAKVALESYLTRLPTAVAARSYANTLLEQAEARGSSKPDNPRSVSR